MTLWKPSREVKADIRHGEIKERLYRLKLEGVLEPTHCPNCGRDTYLYRKPYKTILLTLNGVEHKCVKKIDRKTERVLLK